MFHDDDEYEVSTTQRIEATYRARPSVHKMSYEDLEREIKYERAMVEAEETRISPGSNQHNTPLQRAVELADDGRQVHDEHSVRRQATEEELTPVYERQIEIYDELNLRDTLEKSNELMKEADQILKTSTELGKEADQAIGELDERGEDAKTSTQELEKEAREATHEIKEQNRDRDEPER
jgi:hypothetical protein